jgi:hypothetical protein
MCRFAGGEVPYVLRPNADGLFRLLGDYYFHDIMDGEAFAGADLMEQEFRIH